MFLLSALVFPTQIAELLLFFLPFSVILIFSVLSPACPVVSDIFPPLFFLFSGFFPLSGSKTAQTWIYCLIQQICCQIPGEDDSRADQGNSKELARPAATAACPSPG